MPIFPDFLPQDVQLLTEATSVAFAEKIQRKPISVTVGNRAFTVDTAFVADYGDFSQNPSSNLGSDSGPPILLLHGFDSSMLEFRRLMPKLAAEHPTFALDLLGFGFTDRRGFDAITPEMIKAQVYGFWQEYIGKPMILVGASMGGAAAIDFALTYPEAVSQLVLLDSAGFAKAPALAKFLVPPLSTWATNFLSSPKVRQQVSLKAYFDPSFVTADAECCAALHLQMSEWSLALAAFTRSGGYGFLSDRISEIAAPTKILWGRHDRILGTKDAAKFEQTVKRSKLYWIENCGHVPHLEKSEETAQIILSEF
jgi:pimeloyl-ACP methyl ester carboxylesterase